METSRNIPDKFGTLALTFDDVLLVPDHSNVMPREVDLRTKFTTDLHINVPICSAAMDTVTDQFLAIAIARQGGIGIIHKNMTIEQQADQVRTVKRSESGMIIDPVTLFVKATVGDAQHLMNQYKIGGIPIVSEDNRLMGILTNRDLRFESDKNRPVAEVMTSTNLITAPVGTTLNQAKSILQGHKIEKLPVVDDEYRLMGLITYKDIIKEKDYPISCKDSHGRLVVGAAVGIASDTMDRVEALIHMGVDVVVVDTAHGHSKGVVEKLKNSFDVYLKAENIENRVIT